jgi:hypothetical protein
LAALAGAAWRAGWAALEEFTQNKTAKDSKFSGRADLFLRSPASQDYVESKMAWPGGGTTQPINATGALRALERAQKDAQAVDLPNGSGKRIGVAFTVPKFRNVNRPLAELLAPLFDGLQVEKLDAVAWCFPPLVQLTWQTGRHTHVYPGVVLLAKIAV